VRYILFIIVVLLLAYAWWPEQEIPPVEETFIGDQIVPLRKAEKFQQEDYNKGLDEYRKKMDEQEADDGQ
jgi:hypothetical protein